MLVTIECQVTTESYITSSQIKSLQPYELEGSINVHLMCRKQQIMLQNAVNDAE